MGVVHGANSHFGPDLPTYDPSSQSFASIVQATVVDFGEAELVEIGVSVGTSGDGIGVVIGIAVGLSFVISLTRFWVL